MMDPMSVSNAQHAQSVEQHSVQLHIERLVLHDVPAGDRRVFGAAVERALMRLFAEGGAPDRLTQGGARASLRGGTFAVPPGADQESIAVQVAQAVYEGLRSEF